MARNAHANSYGQVAKLEAEIETIDKSIKEEKKKLSLRKGSAKMEITVVITADSDTRADLKLSYSEFYFSCPKSDLTRLQS